MNQSIENISFSGTSAQNFNINVESGGVQYYRVSIDTSAAILGDKTITFTGAPQNNVTVIDIVMEGGINTSGSSKLKIGGVTIADRIAKTKCSIKFEYVNSSWTALFLVDSSYDSSISGSQIIDNSVVPAKITAEIAGNGLSRNDIGGLIPKLELINPTLQVVTGETGVKLNASGGITSGPNGIGLNVESVDPSLQILGNQAGLKMDPNGGLQKGAAGVSVKSLPAGQAGGLKKTSGGLVFGTYTEHIVASFEAGSNGGGGFMLRIPYTNQITAIRGSVSRTLSGTDDGSIEFRSATSFGGAASPLAGPYTIPMGAAQSDTPINDSSTYTPSGYDGLGGWYLRVICTKTTPGGEVYLSIDFDIT